MVIMMFVIDFFLYKIACLIWPNRKEKLQKNEDGQFFYFEEFVDDDEEEFF